MASAGATAVLLDIIPVAAGILLFIAFIVGRRERKAEEDKLNQVISSFRTQSAEDKKPDKCEDNE